MAKIRVRIWAKECLAENGISTTEEIAEYIENRSTVGVKSVRSLGSILSSTTGIEKCGKTFAYPYRLKRHQNSKTKRGCKKGGVKYT